MDQWLPDLADPNLWGVVGVRTLRQIQRRVPITPQSFQLNSAIAIVDISSQIAPQTWTLAGWATAYSIADGSSVQVARQTLTLQVANLIVLPKSSGLYLLHISFPRWLPQVRLVVKEFVGEDLRLSDQLYRIEQRLDVINP